MERTAKCHCGQFSVKPRWPFVQCRVTSRLVIERKLKRRIPVTR